MTKQPTEAEAFTAPDWGFMLNGVFIKVAKLPIIRLQNGYPPMIVTLPGGQERHIIERPELTGDGSY